MHVLDDAFGELNIANICRICLFQHEKLSSLYDNECSKDMSIADLLMDFARVQIHQSDGLPPQVCEVCKNQIISAYNFKIIVEQNEDALLAYIRKKQECKYANMHSNIKNHTTNSKVIKEEIQESFDIDETHSEDLNSDRAAEPQISPAEVQSHSKDDESHPLFPCEICDCSFINQDFLSAHLQEHEENKSDVYELPNKSIKSEEPLTDVDEENEYGKSEFFECAECCERFESKLRLKLHRSTVHNNSRRRRKPSEGSNSDGHKMKTYFSQTDIFLGMPNGPKKIQCKICKIELTKISDLRKHFKTHKSSDFNLKIDTVFEKDETDFNDKRNDGLFDVMNEKMSRFYSIVNQSGNELRITDSESESGDDSECSSSRNLYTCELCHKSFDRKYKAFHHQQTSHEDHELAFLCSHCGRRFMSQDLLTVHLKTQCENTEKEETCEACHQKFMWRENLILHTNIQHAAAKKEKKKEKPKEKTFTCSTCNKSFYRQEHLDRHSQTHQPDEKKFECPEENCRKKFNRKDNMKSHMKIHREDRDKEGVTKHLCVYCGRSFSNSSNLIVHMRRHTGEKPYKCDMCDKGFPRSSDLQCHRRTHTGEKPCLCTICGKGFSRSNKLTRHMRIHTGVRPYKCTYCDRAFTQSNDLTLHIRRHTGDKPYVCGICGERFIQGTALYTHRRVKGHYEEGVEEAPFLSISVNNPTRTNFANRVDRIGEPKNFANRSPTQIKPVGRGNFRGVPQKDLLTNSKASEVDHLVTIIASTSSNTPNFQGTSANSILSTNDVVKGITDAMQPTVPIASNSAFLTSNVPYFEEGDFFAITNLEYQPYN